MNTTIRSAIRQATVDDTERIWDFIKIAYKDTYRYMIPDRWEWQYLRTPRFRQLNGELPIWIAEREDRIVGQIAAIPVEFLLGDQKVSGVWGVDLIVLPECRGEGLGRRLIEEVVEANGLYLAVEMSPVTKRIYDKLQYVPLNPVSVYAKIIKLDRTSLSDFMSKWSGSRPWLGVLHSWLSKVGLCYSLLASTLNVGLEVRELLSTKPKRKDDVQIQEVDGFGNWVDELPPNTQAISLGNMMTRDRLFLKWRYESAPHLKYKVFAVYRGNRIVGYSVLRKSDPVEQDFGFIVDLVVPAESPDVLEEVLRHAIEHFRGQTACIQCSWPLTQFRESFNRFGFFEMRKSIPYSYCTDTALLDKLKASKNNWYITRGDSDWDQLYPVTRS